MSFFLKVSFPNLGTVYKVGLGMLDHKKKIMGIILGIYCFHYS